MELDTLPVTEGSMRTSRGEPLPLEHTEVKAVLRGPVAEVEVRQRFRNTSKETIEAVYLFPLPHEASVYRMEFRIRDRVVRGVVKEKEEARRTYEKAKAEGRAATLLEQERPNLFTLSVAHVPPGETIEVTLAYQELLAFDDGEWRFVFPMVATERYLPGVPVPGLAVGGTAPTSEVADAARVRPPRPATGRRPPDVSLSVELAAGRAIGAPSSPTHRVEIRATDESRGAYRVSLHADDGLPNRDFVLAWKAARSGVRPEAFFQREPGRPGTFLLMVTPPSVEEEEDDARRAKRNLGADGRLSRCSNCGAALREQDAIQTVPGIGRAWPCSYCGALVAVDAPGEGNPGHRDVVILVDRSRSQRAASMAQARQAVRLLLDGLDAEDALQLFAFDHERLAFDGRGDDWVPRTPEAVARAESFLAGIEPRGGTELEPALERVSRLPIREGRSRIVVLLTDAALGNEGRLLRRATELLGDTRLYVLGLGPAVNRYLVSRLARTCGGASDVLLPTESLEAVVPRFVRRVRSGGPVLRKLALAWDDAMPADVYPNPVPDLFGGQPVRLLGRFTGTGPSRLVLTATTARGAPFRQEIDVILPAEANAGGNLERLWARQRIDSRLDRLTHHPEEAADIRLEVQGLALRHAMVSPYTSLVAEDTQVTAPSEVPPRRMEIDLAAEEMLEELDREGVMVGGRIPMAPRAAASGGASSARPPTGGALARAAPVVTADTVFYSRSSKLGGGDAGELESPSEELPAGRGAPGAIAGFVRGLFGSKGAPPPASPPPASPPPAPPPPASPAPSRAVGSIPALGSPARGRSVPASPPSRPGPATIPARPAAEDYRGGAIAPSRASKTTAGILRGKFGHMSPEQVRGLELTPRHEVFVLGVLLLELLGLERIFVGDSDFEVLERVRDAVLPEPLLGLRPELAPLVPILRKAMARESRDRYPDGAALAQALEGVLAQGTLPVGPEELVSYLASTFADELERARTLEAKGQALPDLAPDSLTAFHQLNVGAVAETWLAALRREGTPPELVVLRRLHPSLVEDPELVAAFLEEAALEHPDLLRFIECGQARDGSFYQLAEYVAGIDLSAFFATLRKRKSPPPARLVCQLVARVGRALAYASALPGAPGGLIHRDLSPQNVLLGFDGRLKVIGLGMAPSPTYSLRTRAFRTDRTVQGWKAPKGAPAPVPEAPPRGGPIPGAAYPAEVLEWVKGRAIGELDLVFVVDETGSMGAYIEEVKRRLGEIISTLQAAPLCRSLRLGLVGYRDHPPQDNSFASRSVPLTTDLEAIRRGVDAMHAAGGGDGPESVTDGLYDLVRMDWRLSAARVAVWVGDAPPHGVVPEGDAFPEGCPCGNHWYTQAEDCREMGVVIHAVGCVPGIRGFVGAEEVFQTVARTARGLYLPLGMASLLIPLISGVAETELDKQRIAEQVADLLAQHDATLRAAEEGERVRFLTETLQQRQVRPRGVRYDGQAPAEAVMAFRELVGGDVEEALDRLRRLSRTEL